MNSKNIVTLFTTIIVCIILVSAIMIPIISSINNSRTVSYYNGGQRAEYVSEDTTGSYVNNSDSTPDVATINGVEVLLANGNYNFISDVIAISNLGAYWHIFYTDGSSGIFVGFVDSFNFSIDVSAKTLTFSDIGYHESASSTTITTFSIPYGWIALPNESGTQSIYKTTGAVYDAYVTSISDVKAMVYSTNSYYSFDGDVVSINGVVNSTKATYSLEPIGHGSISTLGISSTVGLNYEGILASGYVIPYKVSYTSDDYGSTFMLVNLIPIFVVMGVLIGIATLMFRRN